jgi:hypothetical protein
MSDVVDALLRDMLTWLAPRDRPYAEVMEAWRTNCPRLTVWEEAVERGFVAQARAGGRLMVGLTPAGRGFLARAR